jgi:glutamyl/glutaminyl-tRNA synthetase
LDYINSDEAETVIKSFYDKIKSYNSPVSFDEVGKITKEIQNESGVKGKALYHPLRVALTGKDSGIEFHDLIPIIENGSKLNIEPKIMNMKDRLKKLGF